jgi:predicted RNA-binding Zn-ribbon protein involved in translation (DUF1610 family)
MARDAREIVGFDADYRDTIVTLACPACGAEHAERLPAVMMVSRPVCPACGHADRLEPAAIAAAAARLLPCLDVPRMRAVNRLVADAVNRWIATPEVRELVSWSGVELASGAALDLVPLLLPEAFAARRDDS